ncbi:MAG: hypothetical protein OQK78_12610 [Gammaproteobacteria bacterium]|nr:hypothetical protein [Gammaproteobacteria bacterium]MCW8887922.1 hypothetical protein [Gammaproteobacteria bacterium]
MTDQKDTGRQEPRSKAKLTAINGSSGGTEGTDHHMDRLATAFESSAHRWELMVYPSLFAFIILASYGFFLIYSLTTDIAQMSRNISQMTTVIERMTTDMDKMATDMDNLRPMRTSMENMSTDIRTMTNSADGMHRDINYMSREIGLMNRNVNRMSNIVPW